MSLRGVGKQILLTLDISKLNSFLFTMQECGIDPLIYRLKAKKVLKLFFKKLIETADSIDFKKTLQIFSCTGQF